MIQVSKWSNFVTGQSRAECEAQEKEMLQHIKEAMKQNQGA
jgi:hypothetical protein